MSDAAHNPTAVRRELGQRLRALRQGRELTLVQAAEQVGFSPSRVTKIELAQLKVSQKDVLTMLEVYGETDPEQQALLLSMVREGNHQEWWEGHRVLHPKFGPLPGPGVGRHHLAGLRHPPGARAAPDPRLRPRAAAGGRPDLLEHEVDQLVQFRIRRQEVLTRTDPPPLTLWSVMDEAVLRRQVGGRETMHAQLQRLIAGQRAAQRHPAGDAR